jgi:UDP-N-acetylglucosamine 2-epimerase (non-hydrolysing)
MIYIILGTKGQFLKMFPIMKLLDSKKIAYKFIHTSQHYGIIEKNREKLDVKKPDIYLTDKKEDLKNIWQMALWAPQVIWNARHLPIGRNDYVVIHGDAESTLLGFIIGKMFRAKIVHVEAGIRSGNFFEPFPEELIRYIVSRNSDYCFCPYIKDAANLPQKNGVFVTNGNTVFDSVRMAMKIKVSQNVQKLKQKKYVLFLIHRKENLMIKKRFAKIMDIAETILRDGHRVIWPLHTNTEYEIQKNGFGEKLQELRTKYDLQTQYFFDYVDFMHLVKNCEFVASDGGGLQNETYILNKPMLILRKIIEMDVGIGETAFISFLEMKKVKYFINNYKTFVRKNEVTSKPSNVVVDFLIHCSKKNI